MYSVLSPDQRVLRTGSSVDQRLLGWQAGDEEARAGLQGCTLPLTSHELWQDQRSLER